MWLVWKSRQSACSHLSRLAISVTFLKYDWFERSSQLVQVCFITCVAFLQHDTLKTLTERFVAFILLLQIRCRGKNFNNEKFVFCGWKRKEHRKAIVSIKPFVVQEHPLQSSSADQERMFTMCVHSFEIQTIQTFLSSLQWSALFVTLQIFIHICFKSENSKKASCI